MLGLIASMILVSTTPTAVDAKPYSLGASATSDGAMLTVTHLLDATRAADDAAFERIARGMVIMLASDFGAPVSRAEFAGSLENCTDIHVVSSRPFPKMPQAQAVQVAMRCVDKEHPQSVTVTAEIMADNEHAFAIFPRGISQVWPNLSH